MAKNTLSNNPYLNQPCDRCGKKRRVGKIWKEKIPNFSGNMTVVEYSQIVCSDKSCQFAFDKQLRAEAQKRKEVKEEKEKEINKRRIKQKKKLRKAKLLKKPAKKIKRR